MPKLGRFIHAASRFCPIQATWTRNTVEQAAMVELKPAKQAILLQMLISSEAQTQDLSTLEDNIQNTRLPLVRSDLLEGLA